MRFWRERSLPTRGSQFPPVCLSTDKISRFWTQVFFARRSLQLRRFPRFSTAAEKCRQAWRTWLPWYGVRFSISYGFFQIYFSFSPCFLGKLLDGRLGEKFRRRIPKRVNRRTRRKPPRRCPPVRLWRLAFPRPFPSMKKTFLLIFYQLSRIWLFIYIFYIFNFLLIHLFIRLFVFFAWNWFFICFFFSLQFVSMRVFQLGLSLFQFQRALRLLSFSTKYSESLFLIFFFSFFFSPFFFLFLSFILSFFFLSYVQTDLFHFSQRDRTHRHDFPKFNPNQQPNKIPFE